MTRAPFGPQTQRVIEEQASDTPRTDAIVLRRAMANARPGWGDDDGAAFIDHARTLEREHAELVEALRAINAEAWCDATESLQKSRLLRSIARTTDALLAKHGKVKS